MPPVGYIAYIDEAGDDGLEKIKSAKEAGASEWMVISAVLIKAERESELVPWVRDIIGKLKQHQLTHLHFRNLSPEKKLLVCEEISALPVRLFVVLSHKRNMQGHKNLHAEKAKVNRTAWFYCWMTHLLLERVTTYCGLRTIDDYREVRTIRFEFSDRGGVNIEDIKAYYKYLGDQSRMGMLFNNRFDLDWSVVEPKEIHTFPNKMRAGLQLADSVASGFFAGLERAADGSTKPDLAKKFLPRICADRKGKKYGFGVKLMPTWIPNLPAVQAELLDFYKEE